MTMGRRFMIKVLVLLIICLCSWNMNAQADQDGPFKKYYADGKLQQEGVFKNQKAEGLTKTYVSVRPIHLEKILI
jgi:hypothetical protein